MSNFPKKLRIFLAEQNIKKQDFADAIEVTPTTVSNWLRGKKISFQKALVIDSYSRGKVSMEDMGY